MDLSRWNTRNGRIVAGVVAGLVLVGLVVLIAVAASDGDDDAAATPTSVATIPPSSSAVSTTDVSVSTTEPAPTTTDDATEPDPTSTATTIAVAPASTTSTPATTVASVTTVQTPPTSLVTVPTGTIEVREPIPSNSVGDFGTGVEVEVVSIRSVQGTATVPGEISGPAIEVRLRITNGAPEPVDLLRTQVEVTYGPDRSPGNALTQGTERFEGTLDQGESAVGTYVFGVPADQREVIQISVFYDVDAPIIVFEGPGPAA